MDTRNDVKTIVISLLGEPQNRSGRANFYCCPFHTEQSPSFAVYDDGARCFGKCGRNYSVYDIIMQVKSCSFVDAKRYLGEDTQRQQRGIVSPKQPQLAPPSEPPGEDWQIRALAIIEHAENTLWSDAGIKAREYLQKTRGFNDDTIRSARLGYVPGDYRAWVDMFGLSVPCGIVIPHITAGDVWALKIRRAAGNIRYQQVAGGHVAGNLYGASEAIPGQPLLIDEGEFNVLAIRQSRCGVSAVAIGGTGNKNINQRWFGVLASAPVIFARMDAGSGDDALAHLRKFSNAVRPLQCPAPHKDPNDMLVHDGDFAIWAWLNGGDYETT